jgi:hypothetical protein
MNCEDAEQATLGPFVKATKWLPKPPSDDNWFEELPDGWTLGRLRHALLRAMQRYSACVGEAEAARLHEAGGPPGFHGWTAVTTMRSLGLCRRHRIEMGLGQVDVARNEETGAVSLRGLQTCKTNSCPMCAPAKVMERVGQTKEYLLASAKLGHGLYPFAATLKHGLWSDLGVMVPGQRLAWSFVSGHRQMKAGGRALPPGVERIGYVASWEHTWGRRNGHHPHANGVLMLSRPLSEEYRKVTTERAQAVPTGEPLTEEEAQKVEERSLLLDQLGQIPKWEQRGGRAAFLRRELVRNEDWLLDAGVESEFSRFERCLSELWVKGVVKHVGEEYRPGRVIGFSVQPAARLMRLAADIAEGAESGAEAQVDALVDYLFKEATSLSFEAASGGALKRANRGNYSPFHLLWEGMYYGDWTLISAHREIEQVYLGRQRWGVFSRDLSKKLGLDDALLADDEVIDEEEGWEVGEEEEEEEEVDAVVARIAGPLWDYGMAQHKDGPFDLLVKHELERCGGFFWECAAAWLRAVFDHRDEWPVERQYRILVNGLRSGRVPPRHEDYWPAGRSPPVVS